VATRRNFTQEYKDQAVSLVLDSGRSIVEVAKSIGVHEMTLGKWVKKSQGIRTGSRQGPVRARAGRAGTAPQGSRHTQDGA
jgi:transposase